MLSKEITAETLRWIDQMVIGQNLCPFAKRVVERGQARYRVSEAIVEDELWEQLVEELATLSQTEPEEIDTTLLIHPQVLKDFEEYLDFLAMTEGLLEDMELEGVIQIAGFHPDFTFEDSEPNDPGDYTNRSPYPMLHLLREDSVETAVAIHPDSEQIPVRNVAHLRALGLEEVKRLAGLE